MQYKKIRELFSPLSFLMLFLAGIINAFGVTLFLAPVGLYDSGLSGTSMLLWQITPEWTTLGMFVFALNLPFFLFGFKKQGAVFTMYSLFAVSIYSLASFLIAEVLPIDISASSPFAEQDLLLCAIFGGVISGIGSGLTIRFGGAMDGIEVMAVIFAKKLSITVGAFVMIYNALLYIVAGVLIQSWILPLYSILTYMAGVKTVDFIVEGLDRAKAAVIVTQHPQQISRALCDVFGKGVTILSAHGYYSQEKKTVIYFVVNRFQIARLRHIVRTIDKHAFVSVAEVSDLE